MTPAFFIAFVGTLALVVAAVAARHLPAAAAVVSIVGLALWLAYVGGLSWAGIVGDPARRPPGIVFVVGPVVLFVLGAARSAVGGGIARAMPLRLLIGLQVYRVGVELFLHRLWHEGLVPKMLTYEGANVDIWIGLSAPIVAIIGSKGRGGLMAALAWNVLGLLALANVVVRSALTSPGPLHLIVAEVSNRAVGTFPYTFIAGFLAPLAVTLHVLALRALASRLATPDMPKGTTG